MQSVLYDPIEIPDVAVFYDKNIRTGPQGEYAIRLPAGVYDICVRVPRGWQRQRVTVVPGQVTRVDFTIERSIPVPHLGQVPHCDEAIPAPTHALGTSLGDVRLGMSAAEVQAVLGQPEREIAIRTIIPLQWGFPDTTRVTFILDKQTYVATKISTQSAMRGVTTEGLVIGDSINDFGQIYRDFFVCSYASQKTQVQTFCVVGKNSLRLHVGFDTHNRVGRLTITAEDMHNE
jgi:hypothetical protein